MNNVKIARLIHEAMIAVASKDSPITVWPKVGPSGDLMWIVKDSLSTVVIDATTGDIHGNNIEGNEAFNAVVGALKEWYAVDREAYGHENIRKIKSYIDM